MLNPRRDKSGFRLFILVVLILGIVFRFFNLDYKVYWFDEVYSTTRTAGFAIQEIEQAIFCNQIIAASELQTYQRPKPNSTAIDTVNVLIAEDAKHPPLYFLLAHFWMRSMGSSITASRTLPALLSLLSLPLIYSLASELFTSRQAAYLATGLLALSPFDILFAQTVRQYSLLTVIIIGSSVLLLQALRLKTWRTWILYGLVCAMGLYTHLFFGLTLIAHAVSVFCYGVFSRRPWLMLKYLSAIAITSLLYIPWLGIMATHNQRALSSTDWTRTAVGFLYLVKFWILSFTSLFFDLDFGDTVWTYLLRLPFVLLIGAAIYTVCRQTRGYFRLFILSLIFIPFLSLAVPDVFIGGKRSAVTRYLINCFPGVQLAVAYFLDRQLRKRQRIWSFILVAIFTGSLVSCSFSAFSQTWWNKGVSYFNAETAILINAETAPLVISDRGQNFTNKGNLISLSYRLNQDVKLLLLSYPPKSEVLQTLSLPTDKPIFVYRPSGKLRDILKSKVGQLEAVSRNAGLWQLKLYNSIH